MSLPFLVLKMMYFAFSSEEEHYVLLKCTSNLLPVLRRNFELDKKWEAKAVGVV